MGDTHSSTVYAGTVVAKTTHPAPWGESTWEEGLSRREGRIKTAPSHTAT